MKVRWSEQSEMNLRAIYAHVAADAPMAAARLLQRLVDAGESLADHPHRGRRAAADTRELTTVPPYLIRYRLRRGEVEILRIRHGARRPLR